MRTLDDELRETLDRAAKLLDELQARRPIEARTNPNCPLSIRFARCEAGIQLAIQWAAAIR